MSFVVAITARAFLDYGAPHRVRLEQAGCTIGRTAPGPLGEAAAVLEVLDGADAVIASVDPYTDEVLAARPRLKLISRWGAGYESVDLAACTRHGVIATRVVGALTDAVADHAFALLLGLARRVAEGDRQVREGGWKPLQGLAVHGATLGLVGFGPIGQAVAERARGFQMTILVHDPYQSDEVLATAGAVRAPLARLLAESDFVSLHAATTDETRNLIDAAALALMKPTALLVNTARGSLVDEPALIEALERGAIAGAALDTYAREPLTPDAPIRQAPRTLLMPHSGFNTGASALAVSGQAADAVLAVQAGRVPDHVLNPEVLDSPNLRAVVAGDA